MPSTSVLTAAVLLVFSAHAFAQTDLARRFQGLDRDGDGRITRAEWNGGDRAFDRHDWNGDGVLSGDEVRPGARRDARQDRAPDGYHDGEAEYTDWTAGGFRSLDHDGNDRITTDEWHFDREIFRRADRNGDGVLTRSEFLGEPWTATGRAGGLFPRVDANDDGAITRREWPGSAATFDSLDRDGDGRVSREELSGSSPDAPRSRAYQAGYEQGRIEGRAAGREDRERNQGWDLDGQRELEQADSGYDSGLGPRDHYQAGYREAFRRAYREGWRSASR